jgi:hydrogenase maturation protease
VAPSILVACVGNIFLGDDAFGVEVARRLADRAMPERVRVVEFGIRSYDLAYALMDEWDLVILVDALPRGGQPGTVYVFEPELPAQGEAPPLPALDAHTMNPVAVLQTVSMLGGKMKRMLVVGCEPASTDADEQGSMELSEPVRAALDAAVHVVEELAIGFPDASGASADCI